VSFTSFTCKYRCLNDCLPQGCPTHEASLEYQSVSDALSFDDGKGSKIHMQTPELEAFLCMLNSLAESLPLEDYQRLTSNAMKPLDWYEKKRQ